jgi:hypothetical protein
MRFEVFFGVISVVPTVRKEAKFEKFGKKGNLKSK